MGDSQGQEAAKSVRVNLTIPAPVHELMKRGAALSGLSVSGFIASWLVFDLPGLRAWLRGYHNVRAGELSFEGDPLPFPVDPGGMPLSGAQREDALNQQAIQVKQAQRLLDREQAERDARERARRRGSPAPGGPIAGGSDPSGVPVSSAAPAPSTAVRASGGGSKLNRAERRAQAKVERKAGLR